MLDQTAQETFSHPNWNLKESERWFENNPLNLKLKGHSKVKSHAPFVKLDDTNTIRGSKDIVNFFLHR